MLLIAGISVIASTCFGWWLGKSKGRSGAGALLGFFLGWIGVIILAVMEPSEAELQRRAALTAPMISVPMGQVGWPAEGRYALPPRAQLVAEAIRRDPSLADTGAPGAVERMQRALATLTAEYQLRADVQAAQDFERVAAQQKEVKRQAELRAEAERQAYRG